MIDRPILIAVPNISEGQDEALVAHIAGTDALLDIHSDSDHNRSVLTYGGPLDDVIAACSAMVERAAAALDLANHHGAHPRFGVVDVLPIVPYRVDEAEAQRAVRELKQYVTERLGIPVFAYDRAADDRRALPDVRRELKHNPPKAHPTAGVICLGIRDPLIAFNINIRGTLEQARDAAADLRNVPAVRALGFALPSRGLVQVSTNLVDLESTGPRRIFERAIELGLDIVDAEVVGLIPEALLPECRTIPLRKRARSIEMALAAHGA